MIRSSQNLRQIFDTAAEIEDSGRRADFLQSSCGDDQALRARVEELLRAHASARDFINPTEESLLQASASADSSTTLANKRIGRYRVLQKIGEGGCGIVYMAEQLEPVKRRVALKVIKLGMDTRSVIARFEAERQALALMDHPSIAHVLDAGATETGRPFFVMELVRGVKITEYCDQNNLSLPERLRLFVDVCQAVQHAHQKGIIHRDIKPSNILVTSLDNGRPLPKVIDFGIAKATADVQLTEKTLFTRFELFVGTPAYMSPEQAEFHASDVDTRTDIYALSVLLYELLTGHTPFDSETLLKSGIDGMRRTIRETAPPRPSKLLRGLTLADLSEVARRRRSDPPKLISTIRGDLECILLKGLEKDRTRRYATANGLAADVERLLADEPIAARPPSQLYAVKKLIRRHRSIFIAGAVMLLLMIIGTVASTWQALRATRAERKQVELRIQADAAKRQAETARQEATERAYAADMKAASIALQEGNYGQAVSLLDRYESIKGGPDPRGFEWALLRGRANGDEKMSFPHSGFIQAVASAVDGSWIAVNVNFGGVHIWDRTRGKRILSLPGQETHASRRAISVSPDGRWFACCQDKVIDIYNTVSWKSPTHIPAEAAAMTFSPDGHLVWAGSSGVHFHDVNGKAIEVLPVEVRGGGSQLSFSSDGSLVGILIEGRRMMQIWDVKKRVLLAQPPVEAISGSISPNGRTAALGAESGKVYLWDLVAGREISAAPAHSSWLMDVAFSPDGRTLATAGGDQCIRLWDAAAAAPLAADIGRLRGHWNEVWSVSFSRDGQWLASGGKDGRVLVWKLAQPKPKVVNVVVPKGTLHCGFSESGLIFRTQTLGPPSKLQFWDVSTTNLVGEWEFPKEAVTEDRTAPNELFAGDTVLFETKNGTIEQHSLPTGRLLRSVKCEGGMLLPASISRDQQLLVGFDRKQRRLGLWDFRTGKHLMELPRYRHNGSTPIKNRVTIAPDGRRVAYACDGNSALVWDIEHRAVLHELKGHLWETYCVAFSPNGQRLATSSWDGTVMLWNPETGQSVLPALRAHFAGVMTLTFSADSRTLVTHGGERTLRFWNVATGTELFSLNDADAHWLCPISPDGRTLAWRRSSDGIFQLERISQTAPE